MGGAERAQALVELTETLTDALARETALFEARRPQDAARGSEETGRLANLYRHESARLKREPALLAGMPDAVRVRLLRSTEAFEAVLARHGRAVAAARTITEGLVQAIAGEVAAARASPAGYGAGARPPAQNATAVTLNRRA